MRGACALPAAAFSVWCSPDELLLAPVVGKRLGSPGCSQRGNDALGKLPAVCVVGFNLLDDAEISGGPHSLSTGCLCQQNSTSVSVGSSALGETSQPTEMALPRRAAEGVSQGSWCRPASVQGSGKTGMSSRQCILTRGSNRASEPLCGQLANGSCKVWCRNRVHLLKSKRPSCEPLLHMLSTTFRTTRQGK